MVTVAPDGNRAGSRASARSTGRWASGGWRAVCTGVRVRRHPTDCVRAGLLGGLAAEADLVVSGINHGSNVADDVVYSGTVGAGLEAAVLGTSALCLSQQTPTGSLSVTYADAGDYDFGLAARHGAGLIATILAARPGRDRGAQHQPPGRRPAGPGAAAAEAVLTRPGQRIYPRAPLKDWDTDPGPQAFYLFGGPDEAIPEADGPAGTDVAALRRGLISVTPLSVAAELEEFSPAMTSLLARLPVRAQWPGYRP